MPHRESTTLHENEQMKRALRTIKGIPYDENRPILGERLLIAHQLPVRNGGGIKNRGAPRTQMYTIVDALTTETRTKSITKTRDKTAISKFFDTDHVAKGKAAEKLRNTIAAGNPDATNRSERG